ALPGVHVGGGGGAVDGAPSASAGGADVGVERAGERDGGRSGWSGTDPGAGASEGSGGVDRLGAPGRAGEPHRAVEPGAVRGGGGGEGGGVRALRAADLPLGLDGRWTRRTSGRSVGGCISTGRAGAGGTARRSWRRAKRPG